MDITDYIPNVFGQAAPSYLPGLLGADETKNLQNRANVQGLLGAGLALAQGMSRTGPRRSAAENILGALAGGFGAAGGAYEQGVKNYVTQQQIAQTQLAQQQAVNKLKSIAQAKIDYPDLAPLADIDPGKFAEEVALRQRIKGFEPTAAGQPQAVSVESLRAQAKRAYMAGPNFKPYADSLMEQADRLEIERGGVTPQVAPQVVPQVPTQQTAEQPIVPTEDKTLAPVAVVASQGPDAQLQQRKNFLLARNTALSNIGSKAARDQVKSNSDEITNINKELDRYSVSGYDFESIKKSLPTKFHSQIDAIKNLAGTQALDANNIATSIQKVYEQAQEAEKGAKIEGLPGVYAQQKFGVSDQTKLKPEQLADVLRFANAPTGDQLAQLQRESQKLKFETGTPSPVPIGRGQMLGGGQVQPQGQPQVQPSNQPQAQTFAEPNVQTQAQPSAQTQPQPLAQAQTAPRQTTVIDPKIAKNPLISRPDTEVTPKRKQELIAAQPGLIGATNYTVKNIVDSRNVAKSLLDNPKYLDALSGRTAPLRAQTIGGVVIDQDAYTANEILNNLLGRSFISEIQEMRANSPTGGAVGNVAVAEMNSLSKIRAALTLGMDRAELKKQLESYVANANRAMKTIPNDYARTYGYNGEFDEIFASEVVIPAAGNNNLPTGVRVRAK